MTSVGAESGQPFVVSLLGFGRVPKKGQKQVGIIDSYWVLSVVADADDHVVWCEGVDKHL
jgi:hypothetical protein